MDAAAARALLQRKEGGTSVYDHLTEIILKLITEQPDNALAVFEQISGSVKSASFPAGGARVGGQAAEPELAAAQKAFLEKSAALFKLPGGEGEDATGAGEPVQDLTSDASLLEWANISLGRSEMFKLHLALKHLAAKNAGVKSLRFFGKLLGRNADYIVAEGVAEAAEEEADDAKDGLRNAVQKTGDGPNKFTYWVCSAVGEAWTRLPRVTPQQITVARSLRRYLSGDLTAAVGGHPPFPWGEAAYLRAIISLVSAGTLIAPAGAFTAIDGDETGAIEAAAEWDGSGDLSSADGWVHTALALNRLGRTRANPPVMNDAGEEVPVEDAPEASAPLAPISSDPAVDEGAEEGGAAWDVRTSPRAGVPEGEAAGLAVARSLRWPGGVAVGVGKRWASAYVGYGLPVALAAYEPILPGPIPTEYAFNAAETKVGEKEDVTKDPTPPVVEGEAAPEE
jgi:radial spoke head protein 4A